MNECENKKKLEGKGLEGGGVAQTNKQAKAPANIQMHGREEQ